MRIFWTIVALLALIAAFTFPMGGDDGPQGAPIVDSSSSGTGGPMGMSGRPVTPEVPSKEMDSNEVDAASNDAIAADTDDPENHSGSAETPVVAADQNSLSADDLENTTSTDPVTASDSDADDATKQVVAASDTDDDPEFLDPETIATNDQDPETLDPANEDDAVSNNAPETLAGNSGSDATSGPIFSTDPVSLEVRDDGSTLVDGKYPIRGDGSKESPYVITWDYLISASQDYIPREGLDVIPARIAMLHDKWVSIVGYYIFPMFVAEVNEALVMQNQWDGCCIGVPPSVYDSVEVRFDKPRSMKRGHFALYGTFTGRMKIDPYIANRWLIGLYLMEETDLKVDL